MCVKSTLDWERKIAKVYYSFYNHGILLAHGILNYDKGIKDKE